MHDPVILSSGQTFDRLNIQRWLQDGHRTCPVTRIPIDPDLETPIPNHVLRRLISAWCLRHSYPQPPPPPPPSPPPPTHDISPLLDTVFASISSFPPPHSSSSSSSSIALIRALQLLSSASASKSRLRRRIAHSGAIFRLSRLLSLSLSSEQAPAALLCETLRLLSHLSDDVPAHSYLWEPESVEHAFALASVVASPPHLASIHDRNVRLHAAVVLSRTKIADEGTRRRIVGETEGMAAALVAILASLEERRAQRVDRVRFEIEEGRVEEYNGSGEVRKYWKAAEATLRLMAEVAALEERKSSPRIREAIEEGAIGRIKEVMEKWYKEEEGGERRGRAAAEWALKALEGAVRSADGRRRAAEEAEGGKRLLKLLVNAMGGGAGRGRRLRKLAVRVLSAWLLTAQRSSASRSLLKFAAEDLGALPKALALAQECGRPSSLTRSAALSLAKSLSAFAPSFYLC